VHSSALLIKAYVLLGLHTIDPGPNRGNTEKSFTISQALLVQVQRTSRHRYDHSHCNIAYLCSYIIPLKLLNKFRPVRNTLLEVQRNSHRPLLIIAILTLDNNRHPVNLSTVQQTYAAESSSNIPVDAHPQQAENNISASLASRGTPAQPDGFLGFGIVELFGLV
jgi:hypothetical protein